MKTQRGFSLVELAIVLVIIGLIVGGILTGQDLIRASELNSVISEKNKFQTAMNTFKLKYNGVPGDLRNATSYWSGTANGDNDGLIETNNESYRAWQHLSLSGLIPGSYTGTHTSGGSVLDTNTPASTWKPAGWALISNAVGWSNASTVGNKLHLGAVRTTGVPLDDIMTPQDAYSIDGKIDDGLPARGKVYSTWYGATECSSGNDGSAYYRLNITTNTCAVTFLLD